MLNIIDNFTMLVMVTKNYAVDKPFHLDFIIRKYITYYQLHTGIWFGQSSRRLTIKFQLLFSINIFHYY